jgi:23S rRNA pseudouridine2457 synthase
MRRSRHSFRYIIFNKPYGVLSQFTHESGWQSLADFGPFPKNLYPVGRLDAESEGLLLLTDDMQLRHHLLDPTEGHPRTYLAQVERVPNESSILKLCEGVQIGGVQTMKGEVRLLSKEPALWPRPVPIRFRKNVPTAWLEITLREGKNRQVRRMTAAIGHPTLRLVRTHIAFLSIEGLAPGEWRELNPDEVKRLIDLL